MKKLKLKKRPAKSPQQIQKQKKQRKKIIITCLVVVALLVTSATIYLGFGIFKQVEGFSKEKLLNEESILSQVVLLVGDRQLLSR